jgi:NADH-quinone oxidoreductase subunit E
MSLRRLAPPEIQPASFAFSAENAQWAQATIAKYPQGRQASAVISLLWKGQEQEGWVSHPMVENVAKMLGMPFIRVLEVATFYTMFNLEPVGTYLVQVCTTTPCWLRGSDKLTETCQRKLGVALKETTADGKFTLVEVECLGTCANAPVIQINDDFYEDLDPLKLERLLDSLARGKPVTPGSQSGRQGSAPEGGPTTLRDVK